MLIPRGAIVVVLLAGGHRMPADADDGVYPLIELTDEEAAMIDVTDGSIEDWLAVLGGPTLTASDFLTLPDEGLGDPYDLDFRIWLAWHRSTTHIYVAMERADDVYVNDFDRGESNSLRSDMAYHDGRIMVAVDADHSGGQFVLDGNDSEMLLRYNRQAQWYFILPEVYDDGPHLQIANGQSMDRDWFLRPPYAEGGGRVWGESPTISVTEAYFTAFDDLIWKSPETSVVSKLRPGRTVGLLIDVSDRDDSRYQGFVYHRLGEITRSTDTFVDALLVGAGDPSPDEGGVELVTWGRAKGGTRPGGAGPDLEGRWRGR